MSDSYHLLDPSGLIEPLVIASLAALKWGGAGIHHCKCEVTMSPPEVSVCNILYDKLSIIHPKNGYISSTFVLGMDHTFS